MVLSTWECNVECENSVSLRLIHTQRNRYAPITFNTHLACCQLVHRSRYATRRIMQKEWIFGDGACINEVNCTPPSDSCFLCLRTGSIDVVTRSSAFLFAIYAQFIIRRSLCNLKFKRLFISP